MRTDTFGGSVAFAALVAALGVPWIILASPVLGPARALAWWVAAATATHLTLFAPRGVRRVAVAMVAALAVAAALGVARTGGELWLALAVVLGVARAAFLRRRGSAARAAAAEVVIGLAAVSAARLLATPSLLGVALPIWGFFLVQACGGLLPAEALVPGRRQAARDPFAEAVRRAEALLGR